MDTWVWIAIAAAVVVALILIGIVYWQSRQRRSRKLQQRFGPEYDQTVNELGDRQRAESELQARKDRVSKLHIKDLSPGYRERFRKDWEHTQAAFVDDPSGAIRSADGLIGEVMQLRGYPVADFETRSADISVDHPTVVSNYREAHAVSLKNDDGQATTEELRMAMVNYRELFSELVGTRESETSR